MIARAQAVVILAAAAAAQVNAYASYSALIPNGEALGKPLGHSGGGYTDFGSMFSDADTEWATVCSETWPGGSVTVGSALGDPCCTWTKGGTPDFAISEVPGADTEGTTCASSTPTASSAAAAAIDESTAAAPSPDTAATSNATTTTTTDSEDGSYCE